MKHVVFFSGGACSYCTAKRVIENVGKENVVLLFTDTKIEDEDLYRFIDEAAAALLIAIKGGRKTWMQSKSVNVFANIEKTKK